MSGLRSSTAQVGMIVRAPKTAEIIATHLRGQVVRGELRTGQTLPPETQLMEQFGVSRPTLREAFRILEAESLISVRRGSRGGAQVTTPDLSVAARAVGLQLQIQGTTIDDVYQARMVSEPACARLLAQRREDQDIADLTEVVEALKAEVAKHGTFVPDPDVWSSLTYRFHELILQRSGNRTLAVQGAVLQDIVATHIRTRVQRYDENDTPERFQRVIRSYERFISLIRNRNADMAERHWRSHMEAAAQYLLKDDLKNKSVVELFS
ncbi:regulatory protein GntR HTH [Parafrankia sp. EAN1pec]|uniref:FadR/GntR family transcriptional regulator n=1 Tax=Parafrankia sp. (strain EAN1pec) TaxID=298653 RepID=UPI00005411A3|nr:regulatory protein GntR HTH [Frankia sp. EAN1pec]